MFTADVTLEQERALKEYGRDHGRLVMGPDAGVGLLERCWRWLSESSSVRARERVGVSECVRVPRARERSRA